MTFALYVVKMSHFSLQAIAPSFQIRYDDKNQTNELAKQSSLISQIYILCKPNLAIKILQLN